jgi:phosphoribosylanthranilate isomerase
VLVDAKVGGASGGLGVSFDWERARRVLRESPELRVIVAGGLRPETVAEAVRVLEPYGVDVASGVEASAGKKDFIKVQDFIENARRA